MEDINKPEEQVTGAETKPKENEEKPNEVLSAEERLAQLTIENKKLKMASDKAASEAAAFKKQLREKLSADEIAMQEKAEKEAQKDEELNKLRKENTVNKFTAQFLALGYDAESAAKAANSQYENDTDELFKIQNSFLEAQAAAIKENLMKSMPTPPMSNTGEINMTKEEFDKLGYTERLELKQKNPQAYEALAK